jgi:ABC-2 type transport system ATP-binding protein
MRKKKDTIALYDKCRCTKGGKMMDYVVRTSGLTKKVKGKELVSNINLHIKKGEIYGFLGQNGAGKTTIMKMLTGLTIPTSGEIELFGQRLTESSKAGLKRVGSIIEYPIFYEHLTALKNLKIHCEYLGFYDEKVMKEALDMVNLEGIEDKIVKDFSLGMKQRLGIARAIITKPELIILDEPTNGLDPIGIKDVRDLIRMLNKEYGITFLLSSHILGEMEQVVDRIGVINNGKLLNEVTLADIRNRRTDYIELVTSDVDKTVYLLENKLQISNMKIIQGNRIRIYDLAKSQNDITKMLVKHDIGIEEIQKHTSSLEDYFYEQINGGGKVE